MREAFFFCKCVRGGQRALSLLLAASSVQRVNFWPLVFALIIMQS